MLFLTKIPKLDNKKVDSSQKVPLTRSSSGTKFLLARLFSVCKIILVVFGVGPLPEGVGPKLGPPPHPPAAAN